MVFERRRMRLPAKNGRIKGGPTVMSHLILYLLEVKRLQKSEGREVRLCLQQARRRFDPVIHSTLFQLTKEDGQRRISVSMLAQSINTPLSFQAIRFVPSPEFLTSHANTVRKYIGSCHRGQSDGELAFAAPNCLSPARSPQQETPIILTRI